MNLNQLFCEMIQYYRNDPKRIQHFTKVHSYAKLIGELSGMQGEDCLLYTSPSPRDGATSRMPSSA